MQAPSRRRRGRNERTYGASSRSGWCPHRCLMWDWCQMWPVKPKPHLAFNLEGDWWTWRQYCATFNSCLGCLLRPLPCRQPFFWQPFPRPCLPGHLQTFPQFKFTLHFVLGLLSKRQHNGWCCICKHFAILWGQRRGMSSSTRACVGFRRRLHIL